VTLLEILLNLIIKLGLFFIVVYINIIAGALLVVFLKRSVLNYFKNRENNENIFNEILKKILNLGNSKNIFKITSYISLGHGIILPLTTILFYGYPFGFYYFSYKIDNIPSNYIKTFSFLFSLIFECILIIIIKAYPTSIFWTLSLIIDLLITNTIFILINTLPIFPSLISLFIIDKLKLQWVLMYKNISIVTILVMFIINGYAFIINKVVYFSYNALINIKLSSIYLFLSLLVTISIIFIIILRNKIRLSMHNKINKTLLLYKDILEKIKNIENGEI